MTVRQDGLFCHITNDQLPQWAVRWHRWGSGGGSIPAARRRLEVHSINRSVPRQSSAAPIAARFDWWQENKGSDIPRSPTPTRVSEPNKFGIATLFTTTISRKDRRTSASHYMCMCSIFAQSSAWTNQWKRVRDAAAHQMPVHPAAVDFQRVSSLDPQLQVLDDIHDHAVYDTNN